MGLSLVVGPAHAGKVALLLERFVDALDRDPWLIVPNRVDVDRVERELAGRKGALLAGTVGTFDTSVLLPRGAGPAPRVLGDAERTHRLAAARRRGPGRTLGPSARFAGFTDSLAGALAEIEASLLEPGDLSPELAALAESYRAELERLGVATAACCGGARSSGSRRSSARGAARRSSPTGSRISPARSGG